MPCDIFLNLPGNIKMPALGFGTFTASGDILEKALDVALETGYRHIDTAQVYDNEEIIGKVLKKWFDSGKLKREEIFITTKLSPRKMRPDNVEERLKESLKKLQLDYVDLYLIHFPIAMLGEGVGVYGDPDVDYVDIWKKMEEQYDAGRAKTIGVSNFSIKKLERLLKNCRVKPVNNQVEVHIYMQQNELFDYCTKNNITVVAYSPLGSKGAAVIRNRSLVEMGLPVKEARDVFEDKNVQAIANKYSKSNAQIVLRFLLQSGMAPIPKSVTPERIKQNFNVFDFSLNEEDMGRLRKINVGPDARVCEFKMGKYHEHPDFDF